MRVLMYANHKIIFTVMFYKFYYRVYINYIQEYTQLFVFNNHILSVFNSTQADIL
jgi:hypothetical protein